MYNTTVSAISTPFGKGGVSMIRISGSDAIKVASFVFKSKSGIPLEKYPPNTAVYGEFFDSDGSFDDGMVTCFVSPRSYTGENTAELCCHGGILVTSRLLKATFSAGAVQAGAGEFTKRAYINGKLTLTQAEAVGEIIDAKTERHLTESIRQCRGSLSKKIDDIINRLTALCASVYAFIDYPDEDMTDVSVPEMKDILIDIQKELKSLLSSFKYGKAISGGVNAVIAGRPNTGKSSLLNFLSGYDRAIVTSTPGTTRDVVTEQIKSGDVLLNLSDTAGIRESDDEIEQIGIAKSYKYIESADIVFLMIDAHEGVTEEDRDIAKHIYEAGKESVSVAVFNKTDLDINVKPTDENILPHHIYISALTPSEDTHEAFEKIVSGICGVNEIDEGSEIIIGARQNAALERANESVLSAITALDGYTQDVAGIDIEEAISALAEMDGKSVSESIVTEIFSHFCVGK